ncbi:MAG: response regulator [Butyricicoccus pullicaecorum]|nr:response regulator [Butyricicoccus pullicaecorum]
MVKVVLADDENKIILLMRKLIEWDKLGYEIVGTANDGLRALELVQELQPQLLITDIRMPGCDGLDLIRRAKEIQPALHCIVISGYRQFEYAQQALKYGVEDYLLKPIKQEEMTNILLRVKDKLGERAALEFQLQKSDERRQEQLLDVLCNAAEQQKPFLSAAQLQKEYGWQADTGTWFAALVKPDISCAEQYQDGYQIMMRHALEVVRREVEQIADEYAVAGQKSGVAVLLYLRDYRAVDIKQCFTKIRKGIEKQRDLFWDIRSTVCLGSRRNRTEELTVSMREALWLCRDRLCHVQPWRDAEIEEPTCTEHYRMDAAQKKRFQEAAEYLDTNRYAQELEDSYHYISRRQPLTGQMLEDWFRQVLEVSIYGMKQNGQVEERFSDVMEERFWRCSNAQEIFRLLQQNIKAQIERLGKEISARETRPILEAKRYMQQHYQEPLRLEDVSSAVGFNSTYFSALFKKETGQNFMDYLTELRISKSKELLCCDAFSVQDVAEQVGYRDLKYFSRLFKKNTGVSPSDYKKLYR